MSGLQAISAERPLLLVGCGRMGTALLRGWLQAGLSAKAIKIIDPEVVAVRKRFSGVTPENFVRKISQLPKGLTPGFVVLAVKPQMMAQAMKDLTAADQTGVNDQTAVNNQTGVNGQTAVFLSIAAGKTIGYFSRYLGLDAAIVRAMPNTPAAIGKGITVCCANPQASAQQKAICHDLLAAVGAVEWVADESLMDAVTAVSGSGPAYVFYLAEALAQAGEQAGLDPELAAKLARHTIFGAGALLEQSAEDAAQLRKNVTSPKGTTEAALKMLMAADGLKKLMGQAVQAAVQRSRELAD